LIDFGLTVALTISLVVTHYYQIITIKSLPIMCIHILVLSMSLLSDARKQYSNTNHKYLPIYSCKL